MECHHCPHGEKVAAGKFRGLPFDKTRVRRVSWWRTRNTRWSLTMAGRLATATPGQPGRVSSRTCTSRGSVAEEDRLPLDVMSEAIAQLLTMPPVVRDVIVGGSRV